MGRAKGGPAAISVDAFASLQQPRRGKPADANLRASTASSTPSVEADHDGADAAFAATFGSTRGKDATAQLHDWLKDSSDEELIAAAADAATSPLGEEELLRLAAQSVAARSQAGQLDFAELAQLVDIVTANKHPDLTAEVDSALAKLPLFELNTDNPANEQQRLAAVTAVLPVVDSLPQTAAALQENVGALKDHDLLLWAQHHGDMSRPVQQRLLESFATTVRFFPEK